MQRESPAVTLFFFLLPLLFTDHHNPFFWTFFTQFSIRMSILPDIALSWPLFSLLKQAILEASQSTGNGQAYTKTARYLYKNFNFFQHCFPLKRNHYLFNLRGKPVNWKWSAFADNKILPEDSFSQGSQENLFFECPQMIRMSDEM